MAVRITRPRHGRGRCPRPRARRGGRPLRGARVVATGRRPNIDDAELPEAAIRVPADLRDPEQCRRLVHEAASELGGLDIVVNNAATLVRRSFLELELDDMDAAWEVNLRAPALIMQESFEYLRRAEHPASSTSSRPPASTAGSPP